MIDTLVWGQVFHPLYLCELHVSIDQCYSSSNRRAKNSRRSRSHDKSHDVQKLLYYDGLFLNDRQMQGRVFWAHIPITTQMYTYRLWRIRTTFLRCAASSGGCVLQGRGPVVVIRIGVSAIQSACTVLVLLLEFGHHLKLNDGC